MNTRAYLVRCKDTGRETLGELLVYQDLVRVFACKTLEPPWKCNVKNESCIPPGTYEVTPRETDKRGHHFHVLSVPDRNLILFHVGNFISETEGCILVGTEFADLNDDKHLEIFNSRHAMMRLVSLCPDGFRMTVLPIAEGK